MSEPATKKRKALHAGGEASLNENLESLANLLKTLQSQVAGILDKKEEDSVVAFSDIQSFQASLSKFRKSFDRPAGKYKCPDCAKAFVRLDRLLVHCDTYHKERNYLKLVCPCSQSFKHLRDRNTHLRKCHQDYYNEEQVLILGVTGAGETQGSGKIIDKGVDAVSVGNKTGAVSIEDSLDGASIDKDVDVILTGGYADDLSTDKDMDSVSIDRDVDASTAVKGAHAVSIDIDSHTNSIGVDVGSIGKSTDDVSISKHVGARSVNEDVGPPNVTEVFVNGGCGNESFETELPRTQSKCPRVMKLIIRKKNLRDHLGASSGAD